MTWTQRVHEASRLGVWLLSLALLAACASILGIEERKQDTAGNYPLEGYAGCRPGNCDGCLDVHRQECQLRTTCADALNQDDCAGCVCQNCLEPVVACQLDPGCAAIWQCLRETRCDLSERANGGCLDSCGSVLQANGGSNGPAFRAAAEIRTCATSSACLTCLAPQVQQSTPTCTQSTGCGDCPDCFGQCLCSGEKFGACQRACGAQAPPSGCSEADSCAGCSSCFDACACNGGSYDECIGDCTDATPPSPDPSPEPNPNPAPPPPPSCSSDTGCVGCIDCTSQCVCSGGGDEARCSMLCAAPPPTDACDQDPRGIGSACGGCHGCIAQCTCSSLQLEDCLRQCPPEQDCTGTSFNACLCNTASNACFTQKHGSCSDLPACQACACDQCPGELGMCLEISGCQQTFDCMRSTGCQGSACLTRCSGASAQAFDFAEALWACYKGARCSCNNDTLPAVQCPSGQGQVQCQGFLGTNLNLAPCCPSTVLVPTQQPMGTDQSGTIGTAEDNPCGLDVSAVSHQGRTCEPRAQGNPPRYELLETCSDANILAAPYNGALLKGCCRGADHSCGYYDDITGLGCLSSAVFGVPAQTCP